MSVTAFRILVIVDILLAVMGVVADIALESFLPQALRDYKATEGDGEFGNNLKTWVLASGGFGVLVVGMTATIGLLCLWRPARWLYTLACLLSWPLYVLAGSNVSTGVGHMFLDISTFLGGVIWALIYFSPLKIYFDRPTEPLPA